MSAFRDAPQRGESGIALPAAMFTVLIIAVMGAGLLVFSSTNLQTTIEVNRGQRAFEGADTGLEAARRQLSNNDATVTSYDVTNTSDNSDWYGNNGSTPKTIDFLASGDVKVGIQYLRPSSTNSQAREAGQAPEILPSYGTDSCNDSNGDGIDDELAPDGKPSDGTDACRYPNNRNYFAVTSSGGDSKALRKVQAIYYTQNFDFPIAYYATRDINLQDSATSVGGLSLFANRYITGLRSGMLTGEDQAYGNWTTYPATGLPNGFNAVPRKDASGSSTSSAARAAGAAALGDTSSPVCEKDGSDWITKSPGSGLTYSPSPYQREQKSFGTGPTQRYGYRDLDRDSDYKCSSSTLVGSGKHDFRKNTWGTTTAPNLASQPANVVTFPFAAGDIDNDNDILEALKEKADSQGLYIRKNPGESFTINDGSAPPAYPEHSDLTETVMYIEFSNPDGTFVNASGVAVNKGEVLYKARSDDADNLVKGIIVVVNGDFDTSSSADDFQGVVIVRDSVDSDAPTSPGDTDVSRVMQYRNDGSLNVEGFVNVEGDINLKGSVDGFLPGPLRNGLPGLFRVSQWSWRECYNTACN